MMPTHTIAICTKNRVDGVRDAVESALMNPDTDVIIVDQNDDDRLVEAFAGLEGPHLRHLRTDIAGAGRARNIALRAATTTYVCFTDDDCTVDHDYAKRFEAVLDTDDRRAVAFCRVDQGGDLGKAGYAPLHEIDEIATTTDWDRHLRPEDLGIGAGMIVRREAALDVGGFDPFMGPGGVFASADDRELALRLLLAGHVIADTPTPVVMHYGHRAAGREARALTSRDFIAMGAMMAKFAKVGTPHARPASVTFVGRLVGQAIVESVRRRRPTAFGKPLWAVVGLWRGLRSPVDPSTIVYRLDRRPSPTTQES
ncbi:MAG: glycosyltransferase [Actinomycetota bacterium]